MNHQVKNFRNQVLEEIQETLQQLQKLPEQYIAVFIKKRLPSVVQKFLNSFGFSYEQISFVDFSNLVGDLILKYYELDEHFEKVRYSNSISSKEKYMNISLERETKRLLLKELKYKIKKPLTKAEKSHGLKLEDKELSTYPEDVYAEEHNMMKEQRALIYKLADDFELWEKGKLSGRQLDILKLLVGKNSIKQIAEVLGMKYNTVYMAARRMVDIVALKL